MQDAEKTFIVPVPALVAVLLAAERDKGSSLSQEEVVALRDAAECIVMTADELQRVAESRGYDDIDPENVWDEWLDFCSA